MPQIGGSVQGAGGRGVIDGCVPEAAQDDGVIGPWGAVADSGHGIGLSRGEAQQYVADRVVLAGDGGSRGVEAARAVMQQCWVVDWGQQARRSIGFVASRTDRVVAFALRLEPARCEVTCFRFLCPLRQHARWSMRLTDRMGSPGIGASDHTGNFHSWLRTPVEKAGSGQELTVDQISSALRLESSLRMA